MALNELALYKKDIFKNCEELEKLMKEATDCLNRFIIEYDYYGENFNNKIINKIAKKMEKRVQRRQNCYVINVLSLSKI